MLVLLNALQAGNLSGTGRYAAELARWMPAIHSEFDFLFLWPRDTPLPPRDYLVRAAFTAHDAAHPFKRLWVDQVAIKGIASRAGANLVHFPANIGPLTGLANTVVTVHDLSFFRNPAWFTRNRAFYYRRAVAASLKTASRVIAVSRATADDLAKYLHYDPARIDVVHSGLSPEFDQAPEPARRGVRERYGLPESFLLFMATLEPRKNVPALIQAWSKVAGDLPHDLVLAGREGWHTGAIHRAIEQSPHRNRIHLPGYIAHADQPALYSAAHAFLWPSLWEGFGWPPLEAMACGTPVLTSNCSSLPEITDKAALLVDPTKVDDIAAGIVRIATDQALRRELVTLGRIRAASFSWERTARETVEVYRRVLSL